MRKRITLCLLIFALMAPLAEASGQRPRRGDGRQAVFEPTVVARVTGAIKRLFPRRVGSTGDHMSPPWPGAPTQPASRTK